MVSWSPFYGKTEKSGVSNPGFSAAFFMVPFLRNINNILYYSKNGQPPFYPKGITNAMWKTTCSQNKHHFKMVFILSVSIEVKDKDFHWKK
jgi:hypothetical protein